MQFSLPEPLSESLSDSKQINPVIPEIHAIKAQYESKKLKLLSLIGKMELTGELVVIGIGNPRLWIGRVCGGAFDNYEIGVWSGERGLGDEGGSGGWTRFLRGRVVDEDNIRRVRVRVRVGKALFLGGEMQWG